MCSRQYADARVGAVQVQFDGTAVDGNRTRWRSRLTLNNIYYARLVLMLCGGVYEPVTGDIALYWYDNIDNVHFSWDNDDDGNFPWPQAHKSKIHIDKVHDVIYPNDGTKFVRRKKFLSPSVRQGVRKTSRLEEVWVVLQTALVSKADCTTPTPAP